MEGTQAQRTVNLQLNGEWETSKDVNMKKYYEAGTKGGIL